MSGLIPMFNPAVPGAIVVPAHSTNVLQPINNPKVLVLHTPEEPSDDIEVTPYYFQNANLGASTHFYGDSDGDLYQMVPIRNGAIANGVTPDKPYPAGTNPVISLNYQSESIEFEGYAATIAQTMPRGGPQWKTGVRWIVHRSKANGIPIDRDHIIGHYQVASNRTDPGTLDIDQLVRDAQEEADEMTDEERKRLVALEEKLADANTHIYDQAVRLTLYERDTNATIYDQAVKRHLLEQSHKALQGTVWERAVALATHGHEEDGE